MFVKLNRTKSRTYVQIAESFRDELGRPRNRVLATLGCLEDPKLKLDSLINGLLKATGRGPAQDPPSVSFESAKALGDVWALQGLWEQLGFDELRRIFRRTRRKGFDCEQLLRVMVFNRLSDPASKLGVLRWLETVAIPKLDTSSVTHAHLLRAMDDWVTHEKEVMELLGTLFRPLLDTDLSVVFYDLTTIGTEGHSQLPEDLRAWGRSKEDTIKRQFALGLVQTAEGLPIAYQVFEGNVAETQTLLPTVAAVANRFDISRVVLVADRGLLSLDNLQALSEVVLPSGKPLEYVLAVPARRYAEFAPILERLSVDKPEASDWVAQTEWRASEQAPALRLVVAHSHERALESGQRREATLAELAWTIDEKVLRLLQVCDGKLVVLTNVTDLSAEGVIERYKSLADIERGFRVLKSEIEIGPVFHRLPDRIRAHAGICFMALVLHRVMRGRLQAAKTGLSPSRSLQLLRTVQEHQVLLNGALPIAGISRIDELQAHVFKALDIQQPTAPTQLELEL